jgi:hypothetical protein
VYLKAEYKSKSSKVHTFKYGDNFITDRDESDGDKEQLHMRMEKTIEKTMESVMQKYVKNQPQAGPSGMSQSNLV